MKEPPVVEHFNLTFPALTPYFAVYFKFALLCLLLFIFCLERREDGM